MGQEGWGDGSGVLQGLFRFCTHEAPSALDAVCNSEENRTKITTNIEEEMTKVAALVSTESKVCSTLVGPVTIMAAGSVISWLLQGCLPHRRIWI